MDTLDGTEWDVVLAGTGIQQSFLALALSRSDKRILHIDRNEYYGGSEAALSLQDAEGWVKSCSTTGVFSDATIHQPAASESLPKLGFSRAYSLALAPQLIYTESKLLPYLVSSKVYRQLEFLAMGSWWVYTPDPASAQQESKAPSTDDEGDAMAASAQKGHLMRIPTTREDVVFSDKSIDLRSKRAVIKVLRFIMEYEAQSDIWEPYSSRSVSDFLAEQFKLATKFHHLFLALTLSQHPPSRITTSFALPRIARHLRSTGKLGAGFNSVICKWGGLAEIAQVGCRAGAVGGAVYVLGKGIKETSSIAAEPNVSATAAFATTIKLDHGETVTSSWMVDSEPYVLNGTSPSQDQNPSSQTDTAFRSISIVSSPLPSLFPVVAEGAPPSAGAIVVFPSCSLEANAGRTQEVPPVYLILHSSDTGECPTGQSVIYASNTGSHEANTLAVKRLLLTTDESAQLVWTLRYQQHSTETSAIDLVASSKIFFPASSLDLVFQESVLDSVKSAWRTILGNKGDDFLAFQDRNPIGDDDDGDEN